MMEAGMELLILLAAIGVAATILHHRAESRDSKVAPVPQRRPWKIVDGGKFVVDANGDPVCDLRYWHLPHCEANAKMVVAVINAVQDYRQSLETDGWDKDAIERGLCRPGLHEMMQAVPTQKEGQ